MTIDFHTHVFPEALAPRAIEELRHTLYGEYQPVSDGTVAGLIRNMDDWKIDVSVISPVIIKKEHVRKVNQWIAGVCSEKIAGVTSDRTGVTSDRLAGVASERATDITSERATDITSERATDITSDRLVGFGGVYPHDGDFKADIDHAVSLGLKGLKFHAEYQDFIVDDKHMLKIYDYALGKGLIILQHAGFDPGFRPPFKSSPKQFANIVSAMRGGIIVAAHLGGHDQWDDVEKYLVGSGIYLDTSMGFEFYPHDQFKRIVKNHGADKILFGSDAPWSNAGTEIEALKSLDLTENEKNAISGDNAKRILGLASN